MEELFQKPVSVLIKSSDRDERQIDVGVTILLNVISSPVHKKELLVRLTDESDPFFLFTLALGEDDFQGLKSQQGLLVDFAAFPQKFIDLLELCLSEAANSSPKFLLQFLLSPTDRGVSVLNVVETNPFRHLTHLSLKFIPASDTYLKKYLAECLVNLKSQHCQLSERLAATKSDLSAQLAQSQEALHSRSRELEGLRSQWSSHTTSLTNDHAASLTAEREKLVQSQANAQRRQEEERREMERGHATRVTALEGRLQELDHANKELMDHKYRSEAAIRELKTKLRTTEEECFSLREQVSQLRRDNSSLDSGSHEHEKSINQLRTRVAVLEQELQDKEQVISRTSELLEASNQQRRTCELSLEQKQRQIVKLDTAFKSASQEVMKGNEIIQKLQIELRAVKSKLKLRNVVTMQQEKLLGEKDAAIDKQRIETQGLTETLAQKQEELRKLEETLESTRQRLEESRELLKTNENVISWLNKQMNEQMAGGRRPPMGLSADSLSSLRPSPSLPYINPATAGLPLQHRPQFSSTPTALPGTATATSSQRQVLSSLASHENTKPQVVFHGPFKKTGVPSPLSSHSLSAGSLKTTPPMAGGVRGGTRPSSSPVLKENPDGGPWIDPKYLPPEASPSFPLGHIPGSGSVTPGVVRPLGAGKGRGTASGGGSGQTRLASSYFPKS